MQGKLIPKSLEEPEILPDTLIERTDWSPGVRAAAISALFLLLYYPVIRLLAAEWLNSSGYSHGFLIPLISAYLIWERRARIRASIGKPNWIGLGVLLSGLGLLIMGTLGEEPFFQQFSLPITLIGLIYFLEGSQVARVCAFPVAYLYLMIPLPYPVYKTLALKLRLLVTGTAAYLSSALGVPTYHEGYMIHLPNVTLEVADGCSGILSIFSLLALGIFYVQGLRTKRRWVLWIALVPIAVVANVMRIVIIALVCFYSGRWILESVLHRVAAVFNFLLGFLLLFLIAEVVLHAHVRRRAVG